MILQQANNPRAEQKLNATATGAVQTTIQEILHTSSNLQSSIDNIATITNENRVKMDEAHTKTNQILDNTKLIRTMAERIATSHQDLVKETLGNQPVYLDSLKKEIDQSIERSLVRYLTQHFRHSSPSGGAQHDDVGVREGQGSSISKHPVHFSSTYRPLNEDLIASGAKPVRATFAWLKKSSFETQRTITRNSIVGTTHVRTTTVTYTREDEKGTIETKRITTTVLTYLPPLWFTARGAVLRHQQLEISGSAGIQRIPQWALSSVNVVPENSDIIDACENHDLGKIQQLFDSGLASPYDVSSSGQNLLTFVAMGVVVSIITVSQYHRSTLTI